MAGHIFAGALSTNVTYEFSPRVKFFVVKYAKISFALLITLAKRPSVRPVEEAPSLTFGQTDLGVETCFRCCMSVTPGVVETPLPSMD
jgi:hypothetical protein